MIKMKLFNRNRCTITTCAFSSGHTSVSVYAGAHDAL